MGWWPSALRGLSPCNAGSGASERAGSRSAGRLWRSRASGCVAARVGASRRLESAGHGRVARRTRGFPQGRCAWLLLFDRFNAPILADAPRPVAGWSSFCTSCIRFPTRRLRFISRCLKGRIRDEFPGECLSLTLGQIRSRTDAVGRKCWKLLRRITYT